MNRLFGHMVLAALAVMAALLAAEALTRLVLPQPLLRTAAEGIFFVEYDPETGWVNRPGAYGPYRPQPDIPATQVRINSLGMRGPEPPSVLPPGTLRILFLGDSNTFGYGVEEGERFSDMLAALSPAPLLSLNAGVFGYGPDQALLLYARLADRVDHDAVVLGVSAGDVNDVMSSVNGGFSKPWFSLTAQGLRPQNTPVPHELLYLKDGARSSSIARALYRHSNLYRLVMFRLTASRLYMPDSVHEMTEEKGMLTMAALISELDAQAARRGARLVVLLIPHGVWVEAEAWGSGRTAGYYPMLSSMLLARGIHVVDATPALVADVRSGQSAFLPGDPVHLNGRGNRLVAQALGEALDARAGLRGTRSGTSGNPAPGP